MSNKPTREDHAMADDCADWACMHMPRLLEADLDRRLAEKAAGMPTEAASACSEFLTPNDAPRRRLGPLTAIERRLLRRAPVYTWGVIAALSLVCAITWVRP